MMFSVYTDRFPGLPQAEPLPGLNTGTETADFVFVYDFACGALASLKARLRRMEELDKEVPNSVKSWAQKCKWLVDKFHYKSHVGMSLQSHG